MTKKRARLTKDNNPLTSTDSVLSGFEQVSKSTSQQPRKPGRQKASNTDGQKADQTLSQEDNKPLVRKATFQLSDSILKELDTLHLQLQLEMGKASAPYKEVIVEEAIARLLELVSTDSGLMNSILARQSARQ